MNFKAISSKPDYLLRYFKTIEEIVGEVNLIIKNGGIYIKGMDSSHVSLLDCFIDSSDFTNYSFTSNQNNIIIGISLKSLCKVLSLSEKNDTVIFKMNDSSCDLLNIILENTSRKSKFQIKLLEIENEEINISEIDYQIKIDMNIKRFSKVCQELSIIGSDQLEFIINATQQEKYINIKGDGDIGTLITTLKESENTSSNSKKFLKVNKKDSSGKVNSYKVEINKPEYILNSFNDTFDIQFPIKNIESILKISPIANRALINISKDTPLKLEFNPSENSYIRYYVAPKIIDNY